MANIPKERKKWLIAICKQIGTCISKLDTSEKHRNQLEQIIQSIMRSLQEKGQIAALYYLFKLCGSLLGFTRIGARPIISRSPFYWQDTDQYNDDPLSSLISQELPAVTKLRLIKQLRSEGYSDFHIAQVFGTSEHKIKQLKNIS